MVVVVSNVVLDELDVEGVVVLLDVDVLVVVVVGTGFLSDGTQSSRR